MSFEGPSSNSTYIVEIVKSRTVDAGTTTGAPLFGAKGRARQAYLNILQV